MNHPNLQYGSVCSGIEAISLAWKPLGWHPAWFSEIDPFPNAVLAHHYPDVPNLGDMTEIADQILAGTAPAPDILAGGTPCQAFSVAGARGGLSDPRGALTLKYTELANAIDQTRQQQHQQPSVIVWENVPGVLSDKSNAFGCLLGALAGESRELQPAGVKWTNAGCVSGPRRSIAWRVHAVRRVDTLYLTVDVGSVTRLITDYMFDDRYDEASEAEDERTIDTFIAIGSSQDPVRVISALLPEMLRYTPQPKLAGATVRLVFDDEGKLHTITN